MTIKPRIQRFLLLCALLIAAAIAAPAAQGDGDKSLAPPAKQDPKYPNLGSKLDQTVTSVERGELTPTEAAERSPIHSGESIGVTIHLSHETENTVQFLEENGADPRNTGENYIEAYVPVTLLGELSGRPGVIRVREIIPPTPE